MTVLFINGVNTSYGGSGKASLRVWINSILKSGIKVHVINSVPTFGFYKKGFLLNFFLAIYFSPGTFFRLIKNPLSEFLYKLSPFFLIYILYLQIFKNYKYVIYSHYSIFIYSWVSKKKKRIYIVQDLLYIRAKSMGFSHNFCKFIFYIECYLYNKAQNVICLSYQESRILSKFLNSNIHLASCIDNAINDSDLCYQSILGRVAIVSDWRRIENLHGLTKFFQNNSDSSIDIEFWIYGISSNKAYNLAKECTISLKNLSFYDGGSFESYNDIPTKYFLVPVYWGAGIKLKTLEMFSNGRYVFGTPGAFIGMPRYIIKNFSHVLHSPSEILFKSSQNSSEIRNDFYNSLFKVFTPIGDIIRGIHG